MQPAPPSPTLRIRVANLSSAPAADLIAELDAELTRLYPEPGANHFDLVGAQVVPDRGVFLIAWADDQPVGCAALRQATGGAAAPGTGEIKRMYVRPGRRGLGIGRALLAELERRAKQLGMTRLVLETGERQPEALALYRRAGFVPVARFGEYRDSLLSLCMGKSLAS
jgi:GNAT superfamily N-acetyltransferase